MVTMFGRNLQRNLIDFLADPSKAHSIIERHKEAVKAHAAAAEDYKKQKADALEEIERLKQHQQVHEETKAQLADRYRIITDIKSQTDKRAEELDAQAQGLAETKVKLNASHIDHQNEIQQFQRYVAQQELLITQRKTSLDIAEADMLAKGKELEQRETKLALREQAIKTLVNTLRD